MNKGTIIWLSIVSLVLIILITVLLTLGFSRQGMVRSGQIVRGTTTQQGAFNCIQNDNTKGNGLRKNAVIKEGKMTKDITIEKTVPVE